jgi:hypothetical protein
MKLTLLAVLGSAAVALVYRTFAFGRKLPASRIESIEAAWGKPERQLYTRTYEGITEEERRRRAMVPPVRRIGIARRSA